jgi:hypothetical protein
MRRRSLASVVAAAIAVLVLPAITNIAAAALPPAWASYAGLAWPAAVLLAVPVIAGQVRRETGMSREARFDGNELNRLAEAVSSFWRKEAAHRRIFEPYSLPVSWATIGPPLSDHWSNISGDGSDAGLVLDGTFDDVDRLVFQQLPARRLVILGEPGSGKTALLVRLTLTLLATRATGSRVPVPLRLSTWDTATQSLEGWIVQRLADDYGLRMPRSDGLGPLNILPVLDGLDEMLPERRHAGLVALDDAVRKRNLPLVLTSRTSEYVDALAALNGRVVARAAVVELRPLSVETSLDYLVRSTPPATAQRWRQVLSSSVGPVARTLTRPLMVSLARSAYADGDADPRELLSLADDQAVEDRLLDQMVSSVYPDPPRMAADGHSWTGAEARRWMSFLARQLRDRGTHDVAWWEIKFAVSNTVRIPANGLLFAASAGVVFATVPALAFALPGRAAVGLGLVVAAVYGPALAIAAALAGRFGTTLASAPGRSRMALRRTGVSISARVVSRRVQQACGAGVLLGLAAGLGPPPTPGPSSGALIGLAFGLVAGPIWEFTTAFDDADTRRAIDPDSSRREDRRSVLILAAVSVMVGGPLLGLIGYAAGDLRLGLATAIVGVLTLFLASVLGRASTQFEIARFYLALTGRLPLRLTAFLQDAYAHDVLRQAGAVYQFRHALLRDRLAARVPAARRG